MRPQRYTWCRPLTGIGRLLLLASMLVLLARPHEALSATYILDSSITDHGDPTQVGSLQWVVDHVPSPTIELRDNANYRIGKPSKERHVVVPTNVSLVFQRGAVITFANGASTLKIFGSVEAGLWQLFAAAPGQVRLQGYDPTLPDKAYHFAAIKEVYPQWWGANCPACRVPGGMVTGALKNLLAFQAAFMAFPTKVSIPAGTYVLSGEWRLDFTKIPEADGNVLGFEVAGAGQESTVLTAESQTNMGTSPLVGIYSDYPDRAWQYGKFHGLMIKGPTPVGLLIQSPLIHVYDLYLESISHIGIELATNSIGCVFEDIRILGNSTACGANCDPKAGSSGFRTGGGNIQDVVISRLIVAYFDFGINTFQGTDEGCPFGWKIVNCDVGGNQIGIHIGECVAGPSRGRPQQIEILGTYAEMLYGADAKGIYLNHSYGVRIVGGYIDPKGARARQIEIHGCHHTIDMPEHYIFGTDDCTTYTGPSVEIRAGLWCGTQPNAGTDYGCANPKDFPRLEALP